MSAANRRNGGILTKPAIRFAHGRLLGVRGKSVTATFAKCQNEWGVTCIRVHAADCYANSPYEFLHSL
jgi:hypothetical protein